MDKTNHNLLRLLEDFIDLKLDGKLNHRDIQFLFDQAYNYAESLPDYWPDHTVNVTFTPK